MNIKWKEMDFKKLTGWHGLLTRMLESNPDSATWQIHFKACSLELKSRRG